MRYEVHPIDTEFLTFCWTNFDGNLVGPFVFMVKKTPTNHGQITHSSPISPRKSKNPGGALPHLGPLVTYAVGALPGYLQGVPSNMVQVSGETQVVPDFFSSNMVFSTYHSGFGGFMDTFYFHP